MNDSNISKDAARFRFLVDSLATIHYVDIPGEGFVGCKVVADVSAYRKSLRDAIDVLMSNVKTKEVQ